MADIEIPQELFYIIDYDYADEIIQGFYNFPERSESFAMEQGNDTVLKIFFGEHWLGPECWKDGIAREINHIERSSSNITKYFEGENIFDLPTDMMNELAYFGIIPTGQYPIKISW